MPLQVRGFLFYGIKLSYMTTIQQRRKLIKVNKNFFNIYPLPTNEADTELVHPSPYNCDIFYFRRTKKLSKNKPVIYMGLPMFAVITN